MLLSALTHPAVIIGAIILIAVRGHRFMIDRALLPRPSRAQAKAMRAAQRAGLLMGAAFMLIGLVLGAIKTPDPPGGSVVSAGSSSSPAVSPDSLASLDPEVVVQRLEIEHPQTLESLQGLYKDEYRIWRRHMKAAVSTMIGLGKKSAAPAGTDLALVALMQGMTHEASAILQVIAEGNRSAESYRQLGGMTFLDDPKKSLSAYGRAAELDPANPESFNQLGYLAMEVPDLDQAERAYRKLYDIGKARQDRTWLAVAYANMGNVYLNRGELDHAESMYRQALTYEQALGKRQDVAFEYNNLGNLAVTRGAWDAAEESYLHALEIHTALGSIPEQGSDYANLGNVYYNREDLAKAETMFRKALAIFQSLGDQEAIASNYTNLGNVYYRRGDQPMAESLFGQAQQIYRSLGPKAGTAALDDRGAVNIAASTGL